MPGDDDAAIQFFEALETKIRAVRTKQEVTRLARLLPKVKTIRFGWTPQYGDDGSFYSDLHSVVLVTDRHEIGFRDCEDAPFDIDEHSFPDPVHAEAEEQGEEAYYRWLLEQLGADGDGCAVPDFFGPLTRVLWEAIWRSGSAGGEDAIELANQAAA